MTLLYLDTSALVKLSFASFDAELETAATREGLALMPR